jgi:hypothetical protein
MLHALTVVSSHRRTSDLDVDDSLGFSHALTFSRTTIGFPPLAAGTADTHFTLGRLVNQSTQFARSTWRAMDLPLHMTASTFRTSSRLLVAGWYNADAVIRRIRSCEVGAFSGYHRRLLAVDGQLFPNLVKEGLLTMHPESCREWARGPDRKISIFVGVKSHGAAAIVLQRNRRWPAEMLARKAWSCGRLHIPRRARLGLL